MTKPLGDTQFRELRQAWLDANGVLVIRDYILSPDQLIAFCGRFGDLVVWDNRCTLHHTLADDDGTGARYMHRTTALCDVPG